jgi:hypothetical protein
MSQGDRSIFCEVIVSVNGFRDRAMDLIARIKERKDALRRATRHALTRVALMLKVEFSKMYYTSQIVPTLSFEQYVTVLETVRNIYFLSKTLKLYNKVTLSRKHICMCIFLLRVTDTVISQNIDLPSSKTLCANK